MPADLPWKVHKDSKVKLTNYDPGYKDKQSERETAQEELEQLSAEL